MQKWVALTLGVLVPLLGLAGVGSAQSTVQVQGTIQAVDCQAQSVVVATPNSTNTVAVAPYTAVLVDSRAVPLCDLQQYVGSQATIWLVASGNEFIATRIDTTAQAAVVPVALPIQQEAVSPLPLVGIVLGTILLAGLIYLLVRDHDGRYYRYPYYGEYYRHYYRPEYRPYLGVYPVTCPVVYVAAPIVGFVLGVTIFSGYEYLVVRDRDGRYERYPYYGPYRAYYYRPDYRVYAGPYNNAPVRYGDRQGSVPLHRLDDAPARYQPNYTPIPPRPNYQPVPQRPTDNYRGPQQPYQQQPYNDPRRPNYQPVPQRPTDNYRGPQQQYQQQPYNDPRRPSYQPVPQRPNDNTRGPAQYQGPNWSSNARDGTATTRGNGNGNGNGGSRGRDARQVCQSASQGQSCSEGMHNR